MTLLSFFGLALEYWYVLVFLALVAWAFVLGGPRAAGIIASFGFYAVVYLWARNKTQRDLERKSAEINNKREKAYAEIDSRPSHPDDLADRLRRGKF